MIRHVIRLRAPLSHGDPGLATGNVLRFRRIPATNRERRYMIPAISAGALRGVVRRLLWREVFDLCDLSRESVGSPAWDRLYAALANGGHLEKAEATVDPNAIRELRASLPVLSLLGSALYDRFVAGRLSLSHSWLRCREAVECRLVDSAEMPIRDLVADFSTARHVDREEQSPEVSGVTPMPATVEVVVAGAEFQGRGYCAATLEASAWAHGLDLVRHLGGKSGQGCGEVEVEHDGDGARYVEWLGENVEPLRERLLRLAEEITSRRKRKG